MNYRSPDLNVTVKLVCESCNNGWMSDLETATKPVLTPLLRDGVQVLSLNDQLILRTWITLRAMLLEHVNRTRGTEPFYSDAERRAFAKHPTRLPIYGTHVWLFNYRSRRWACRSNVAVNSAHFLKGLVVPMQITTAFVGRFGFQCLVGRFPKRMSFNLASPSIESWNVHTIRIWPSPQRKATWPSDFLVDDAHYEEFVDRFVER